MNTNPGNRPKITYEQYKEIMKLKKEKERVSELTYARLGKKLGLRPSAIVNAARNGIKRYDYQIWKEEQGNQS